MDDNKLNNSTTTENILETDSIINPNPRPRLKKIKRAKIRTNQSLPVAPKKETVEEVNVFTNETSQILDNIDNNEITENKVELDNTNNLKNNDLVKFNNIVNSINENTQSNNLENYGLKQPNFIDEDNEDNYSTTESTHNYINKTTVYLTCIIMLLTGLFAGKAIFSSQVIEKHGLEGVVANQDIPKGRPRCGLTDRNQACVFYIMNWYKQELNGRDFYKLAAQLTGREEYMIEAENLRYATVKIKPGNFAQLNIPALK